MTTVHIFRSQGPYRGVVWLKGMKRGTLSRRYCDMEPARRWCIRQMTANRKVNRAVVGSEDYDDFTHVWKARQD